MNAAKSNLVRFAQKKTITDCAYEMIKQFLFTTESAGVVYSERQLASHLDLGLGPVRTALTQLRTEGLISVLPNVGIVVTELTTQDIYDFYETRAVIESWIVASLAQMPISAKLGPTEEVLLLQEKCVRRGDPRDYHELDMAFHKSLAEMVGNQEILRILSSLRDRMFRLSSRLHSGHPERLKDNFAGHHAILEAIKSRDPVRAKEGLQNHLFSARDFILDPNSRLSGRSPITS